MSIVLLGSTSGSCTLQEQAVAGTTTLTLPTTSGTILTNSSVGTVLQVVSSTKTDTFSTSSQTSSDVTGLSVTITPTSASNKILIMFNVQVGYPSSLAGPLMQLLRNSTAICIGDTASNRPRVSSGTYTGDFTVSVQASMISSSNTFVDSPATTSAVTYKIQLASSTSGTAVYINRSVADRDTTYYDQRAASSITVMEISA